MKSLVNLRFFQSITARLLAGIAVFLNPGSDLHGQARVDFSKDIKPIFQASCYSCHGAKVQMSGLRLDAKKAAFEGGQSGRIIVPGKSAESSLYQRVAGIGEQLRMPMGGKLDPGQTALIRAWIDQGASWPDDLGVEMGQAKRHWAFTQPERPALPKIAAGAWPANPIDYFVLAQLERAGLKPSPLADRVTLLRRLSLDLTGLPPTIAEVDAFLNDKSKNAYEKQIDRLLASPHYGERWGRHWLDAARYADSNGFEKDRPRQVWSYRDWVIHAFNRNLPYDQFIVEQLAGDLLPNATPDQIVATGFLRNSMLNEEGGVDPEQFRMESMFDRMEAIGKGILGVTIQCAQCHNHKFDPLKQEEYYRMVAFINNTQEASVSVYTQAEEIKRAQIFRKVREIESGLQNVVPDWQQRMAAWEDKIKNDQPEWVVLHPEVDDISTGGQKYIPLADGSLLAGGFAPTKLRLKLTAKTEVQNITAIRLELLTDANLPLGGPGRSATGACALTQFDVEAAPSNAPKQVTKVKIAKGTSDYNPPETVLDRVYQDKPAEKAIERLANTENKPSGKSTKSHVIGPVEYAIDGKDDTAWGTDAGPVLRNQSRKAVFTFDTPVSNAGGTLLTVYLKQFHGGSNPDESENNNIGRFRLSITTALGATADPVPQKVREILAIPRDRRTSGQAAIVFSYWRTLVPEWQNANQQIADLWKQHPEGSSQLILAARENPRPTHILTRGDFLRPGKEVAPGVPEFLNPLPVKAPLNRITFAKWMVDRKSPTTARAFVNRLWQAYFGTGLVATAENFGTQSEPPSHPELLDWLAVEFMDHGWNIKAMQRLIVTSATYRQSSMGTEELYSRDPYNRLLARGPRFRVEGEVVRDIALAASGLLNPKIGGPSVFPPAPAFLFVPPASYSPKPWKESTGADRYRRALYTFRYRSVPYPVLQTFDAPNGDSSCVRRSRSDTPLQALATLNETLFVESARALALRTLQEGGQNDHQRITYAFRRCLARKPTEAESAELQSLLDKETQRFASGELNPLDLVADDPARPPALPKGMTPVQAGAWTALARVLLNLDETITKE